jgi:hypothetical protein
MMKRLLLFTTVLFFGLTAQAQFSYTFKDTTTPYVPLTGATSVNGSVIWDEEDFSVPIPFTWKMDNTISLNGIELSLSIASFFDQIVNTSDANGFMLIDADIADRGTLAGATTLSPVRYVTTGTSPNRIFKLELANAGFYSEYDAYGTMNDSFSVQVWIYETKNIVEFHYGPSKISHPGDYFNFTGTGPFTGYLKHVDIDNGNTGSLYYLKGNAGSPSVDSVNLPSMPGSALNSWPVAGKVYRFTPKTCTVPAASFTSGAPIATTVQYTYNGTTSAVDSLIWDFGDGQKQKVTTGLTTPVSHTFSTNGKYSVCVTAYNSCGSHNYCKQTPLATKDLAARGNVKVYPNPAGDQLTIEGAEVGDKVSISSMVGQQVLSTAINNDKQTLNVSSLPAGSYILMLSGKSGTSSVRIVKQ